MNAELKKYIETEIIPRYENFDKAHGTDHAKAVIERALELARHYDVDKEMMAQRKIQVDLQFFAGLRGTKQAEQPLG